ncbi:MAG: hypothetical protein AAF228_13355 [Pseudomonadota bacterium]
MLDGAAGVIEKSLRMKMMDADALGKVLLETNPAKQRQFLLSLERKYGKSKVQRARAEIGRSLAEIYADQFASERILQSVNVGAIAEGSNGFESSAN